MHRVHRGAQARRGLPLRPARRDARSTRSSRRSSPQTDIDEVIIGHTNEPEYRKLQNNEFMEALARPHGQDRHPVHHQAERRDQDLREGLQHRRACRGKHIAPHTLEMAAMWAVLTRLEEPKKHNLTLLQKLKLYDGKTLPGLHRGQRQGAAQGDRRARAWTASRRATSRTRSRNALVADGDRGLHQPVHGAQRARGGPASTTR